MVITGSFRGVPFGTTGHTLDAGRRVATHEFPFRDTPYSEDFGRRAKQFSLDIFVLGDDFAARNRLEAALNARGPGTLVHPWLGTLQVQVTSFSLSESFGAQRYSGFSVTFVEAGKAVQPATSSVSAVGPLVSISVARAAESAAAIDISTGAAVTSLQDQVRQVTTAVQTAGKRAARPRSLPTEDLRREALDALSTFERDVNGVLALITTPQLMCNQLSDVVFRVANLGTTALQALTAYQRLMADVQVLFRGLSFPSTAKGIRQRTNSALFRDSALTAIASAAATQITEATFASLDDALAAKSSLAALFDSAAADVTDNTLFGTLTDIKTQALAAVPLDLPRITKLRTAMPLPTLVCAYDLMAGDEAKLIELNAIRNPWFAPSHSGSTLTVLR